MLAEGHHRVKNSLQVVADLLLLGRPAGGDPAAAAAFEHAESRIRSIAAVHDVLAARRGGRVPAGELLDAVLAAAAGDGAVVADVAPIDLPFQQAQHLGVVVNELVVNAHQHGAGAVRVALAADAARPAAPRGRERTRVTLTVADAGGGPSAAAWDAPGLGLRLVRQVVEQGLGGSLERDGDAGAVTVRFDVEHDARPGR
nr:sensor histidine kinase [Patulibacter sp. SYSU D01012]